MKILALSMLLLSATALAQPRDARSAARPHVDPERAWYGWQIMIADALTIGAVAGGVALELGSHDSAVRTLGWGAAIVGVGSYALAPALIHGFNDGGLLQIGGSLLLRAALPVVGFGLGLGGISGDNGPFVGSTVGGMLAGVGVARLVDWALLSTRVAEKPLADRAPSLWLAPTIGRDGRAGLALSGRW